MLLIKKNAWARFAQTVGSALRCLHVVNSTHPSGSSLHQVMCLLYTITRICQHLVVLFFLEYYIMCRKLYSIQELNCLPQRAIFLCSYVWNQRKRPAAADLSYTHQSLIYLFFSQVDSCCVLAMRAAALIACITANAATSFMCLDDLLGCQIHTTNNNQTNNPGCHTKHLFYFASTLITVSLLYFLAGRKSRYRNAIRKTTATAVPKLNASPPTNTLPNW